VVAEKARKIKRYFINDAKSFGSCSLHPYSFRRVTVALSYARSTQFTFRNLIFPDDLVVFEQGNQPWSRFGSSLFGLLDEELELSFGFLLQNPVVNLKSGERLVTGHWVETAKQRPDGPGHRRLFHRWRKGQSKQA
jgi:hypothetical protein